MNSFTTNGPVTCVAGEALEKYRQVKLDGNGTRTVVYADAGEAGIGVTLAKVAAGDSVGVRLWNAEGTIVVCAGGAVAAEAAVYSAADGKTDDVASGTSIGTAFEAASADGDLIEIIPA